MEPKPLVSDGKPVAKSNNLSAVIASTMPSSLATATTTSLTTDGRKPCNCTRSQCLKLYCDCFAMGSFCYDCNCVNCFNTLEREDERNKAIKMILDRNPQAFQSKIGKFANQAATLANKSLSVLSAEPAVLAAEPAVDSADEMLLAVVQSRHIKGCNCKKSNCLKRYCECFLANIQCSSLCKCVGCKNCDDPNRTLSAQPAAVVQADTDSSDFSFPPPLTAIPKPTTTSTTTTTTTNYTRIKLHEITPIQPSANSNSGNSSKTFEPKKFITLPHELTSILKSTLNPQPLKDTIAEEACSRLINFVSNNYQHLDETLAMQNEQTFAKSLELMEELIIREFGAFLSESV